MNKIEKKPFDINIEKYTDLIESFFDDVNSYIVLQVETEDNANISKVAYERMFKIRGMQPLVRKLFEARKKGFNKPELEKIITEIKGFYVNPIVFEKSGSVDQSAYVAFRDVINGVCEYVIQPVERDELIMRPLVKWAGIKTTDKKRQIMYNIMPMSWVIKQAYNDKIKG